MVELTWGSLGLQAVKVETTPRAISLYSSPFELILNNIYFTLYNEFVFLLLLLFQERLILWLSKD
jgi:hypothetical protein